MTTREPGGQTLGAAPGGRTVGAAPAAHTVGAAPPGLTPTAPAPTSSPPAASHRLAEVTTGVAVVAVDVPLPHLDRGFEYAVPPGLDEQARVGARVKVRFAGRDVDGFVLERRERPEHAGRLTPLRRVVSPEQVLTPRLHALARRIAAAQAGTLSDVLRLAVPPRHAGAEKALDARQAEARGGPPTPVLTTPGGDRQPIPAPEVAAAPAWDRYPAGAAFLRRLREGDAPGAAWSALPTTDARLDWPRALAQAAAVALDAGRGALIVMPDGGDVARVDAALSEVLGPGRHVTLTAAQGPQARYTAWLKALRGQVRVVVGTRAAAFAPVVDLGLVAWWDDGDDSHVEPRAPYPHVRDVLLAHAELTGAAVLVGGFARTAATAALVAQGRLREIAVPAPARRAATPRVHIAGEGLDEERDGPAARAHLPGAAWRAAKAALADAPVLVQVPRRGYLPALSCRTCGARARCVTCAGPLSLSAPGRAPSCRWCGAAGGLPCPSCGDRALRSSVVGAARTAEELGRAFPGVPVLLSGSGAVLAEVAPEPALVIATPGAEPVAEGGYGAALLLDAWALLDRPALDAAEEALRRWFAAAALVVPAGPVVLAGVPDGPPLAAVEALVRWAPEWFAERELTERAELRLPPAVWVAGLTASRRALRDFLALADLPEEVDRLGPLPVPGTEDHHLLLRAPRDLGPLVARTLTAARAIRSARKAADPVTVKVGAADG